MPPRQRDQTTFRGALAIDPGFRARQAGICRAEITRGSKPRAMQPLSIAPRRHASAHPAWTPACAKSAWHWVSCIAPAASTTRRSSTTPTRWRIRPCAPMPILACPVGERAGRNPLATDYFEARAASCVHAILSCSGSAAIHLYTQRRRGRSHRVLSNRGRAAAGRLNRTWYALGGLYQVKGDNVQASAAFEALAARSSPIILR
jgi:hypothetical protein